MIRLKFYCTLSLLSIFSFNPLFSADAWEIKPSSEKGRYYETDILTPAKLANLPIPLTEEDYSFLQSIGAHTCLVLGHFSTGNRSITLITDKDSDGKVDDVSTYMIDLNKLLKSPDPAKEYPAEKFAEMKRQIIEGSKADLNPNAEGLKYLKKIISENSSVAKTVKMKNGYKVYINDADKQTLYRAMFYFSDNSICGSDLVFEVRYRNVGTMNLSPAIKYSVYCKDSKDAMVCDVTKNLYSFTSERFAGSK